MKHFKSTELSKNNHEVFGYSYLNNANSLNNLTVDTAVLQRIALFYAHTIISGVVALELYPVKENTQNNTQDCTTVDNERMIATLMLMDRFRDELHTATPRQDDGSLGICCYTSK